MHRVSRQLSPGAERRRSTRDERVGAVHDGRRSGSFGRALLTGCTRGGSGGRVKAERPVTARAVSCLLGLEPRDGARQRQRTSEVGALPGKARPALSKARRVGHREVRAEPKGRAYRLRCVGTNPLKLAPANSSATTRIKDSASANCAGSRAHHCPTAMRRVTARYQGTLRGL